MQWILRNKDKESLDYLKFIKRCEPFVKAKTDPDSYPYWDYDAKPELKDTAQKQALLQDALQAVKKAKSDFIN